MDLTRQHPASRIEPVCQQKRRLQHRARPRIHIVLATRKPPRVGGVGGIEQQQRGIAVRSGQFQGRLAFAFRNLAIETAFDRALLHKVVLEFQ